MQGQVDDTQWVTPDRADVECAPLLMPQLWIIL
ncbi:hypothetical protein DSM14862_03754 (plasmid) [Sulfitobacter indolifex]|nr:hypothetical protein DSM14862_03353 [Sulfitobacter indolifex]UOA20916.1 hypothetical protein DSM14862_03754 [Sulfitobacter indolifex]